MAKYLVETISTFRIRYVVDCKNKFDAMDTVSMNEANEFGQFHIDENIVGCREVADNEIVELFFEDHPYLQEWGPQRAMQQVHKVNYGTE